MIELIKNIKIKYTNAKLMKNLKIKLYYYLIYIKVRLYTLNFRPRLYIFCN